MENAEEILNVLEDFSKRKPKNIPQELNEYLAHVARTGDPVYQWSLVKALFKEKLLNVITDFYETTPGLDIPPYPNVDPFNYDTMKNSLLERLDAFTAAPFTVQRICELLTFPRKQYNRIDKFLRAIEKNILVVSTREPGPQRHSEYENGDPLEPMVNGSDNNSEYNVDVEMEDMSWKENAELKQKSEPQPSSSDAHISVDDNESRVQPKPETPNKESQEKPSVEFSCITSQESSVSQEQLSEDVNKTSDDHPTATVTAVITNTAVENDKVDTPSIAPVAEEPKMDVESPANVSLVIPEITVDDAEMTEKKLIKQASMECNEEKLEEEINIEVAPVEAETATEQKEQSLMEIQQAQTTDDSSSDSNKEEFQEPKLISEVSTSSEESSSSSDITEGNSNSPKHDSEPTTDTESTIAPQEDSNSCPEVKVTEEPTKEETVFEEIKPLEVVANNVTTTEDKVEIEETPIKSENYSISDVSSELAQSTGAGDIPCKSPEQSPVAETKEDKVKESKSEEPQSTVEGETQKEESQ